MHEHNYEILDEIIDALNIKKVYNTAYVGELGMMEINIKIVSN